MEALEKRKLFASGIGAFAPATATWSLRSTPSAGEADLGTFQFGAPVPVVGDWNGDGRDDIGSFNRNTATWSLRYGASAGPADAGVFVFGSVGSLPVVGDWNGDGRDDIGVYVAKTATWSLRLGASAGPANAGTFVFGAKSAIPVAGDWDGDGTDGIGTFAAGKSTWTLRQTPTAGAANAGTFNFGAKGAYPVVGDWDGDERDGIGTVVQRTAAWSLRQTASAGAADAGAFQFGTKNLIPVAGDFVGPAVAEDTLTTVTLDPLDLNLLGLQVQTSPITVTISADSGEGNLLGNHLNSVGNLVNTQVASDALNNVLGTAVDLVNAGDLGIDVGGSGFETRAVSSTQVVELFVAPTRLEMLGVVVDVSPVRLSVSAHAGEGLLLGNALTDLANLANTLPAEFDIDTINQDLSELLGQVNSAFGSIPAADVPTEPANAGNVLRFVVPGIDLNLLGLELETSPATLDASAIDGTGTLLGNVWAASLGTQNATPEKLAQMSNTANAVLARVFGALNAADLSISSTLIDALSPAMQELLDPELFAPAGSSVPVLDLVLSAAEGTSPPVSVDLLGLQVTTSNIDAHLAATTGDGQVLGNLLYNVVNLTNTPNASMLALLKQLATNSTAPATPLTGQLTVGVVNPEVPLLSVELDPLNLDLLGLEVTTDPIIVNLSVNYGDGELLGNVLRGYAGLLNLDTVNNALNNALATTVNLVNSVDLGLPADSVGSGEFDTGAVTSIQLFDTVLPPIHLDLAGATLTTTPIHLTMTAHGGEGLVLGNVLVEAASLFDNPPAEFTLADVSSALQQMLADLNAQIPGIPPADLPPASTDPTQVMALTMPGIDLNLLGLGLTTDPIVLDAAASTGDGMLLGNLFNAALGTIDGGTQGLADVTSDLNALLAKVIGVFNASTLTISQTVIDALPPVLQSLVNPTLINSQLGSTTTLLDLNLASPSDADGPTGGSVLGATGTGGSIHFTLSATTGEGNILGNLLFNTANLLNPGASSPNQLYLLELAAL